MAARLARLLWRTAPDAALLVRADRGELATQGGVRMAAMNMLTDPRARAGVGAFYRWWLELDRLGMVRRDGGGGLMFSPMLGAIYAGEAERFATTMTLDRESSWDGLWNGSLPFSAAALQMVIGEDGNARPGVLTQPAFSALHAAETHSSPTLRGEFISRRLLCRLIPPHPAGVPSTVPPLPGATTRERYLAALGQVPCSACHQLMDPLGFAFESFDQIGRRRSSENGKPIDDSGRLVFDATVITFVGPIELQKAFTNMPEIRACFVQQWLEFALGRPLQSADQVDVTSILLNFTRAGHSIRELIGLVASSNSFLAP